MPPAYSFEIESEGRKVLWDLFKEIIWLKYDSKEEKLPRHIAGQKLAR